MTASDRPSDERFEADVVDLLAERGRTTNGDVRAALDGIEHLPPRTGGRRSWLAAAAAVAILVVGGGVALGRLSLPSSGNATDRVGRSAFLDDPRLNACEAVNGTAAQVFEMTHAEWFPLYFPGWYRGAPELEVADPALVAIGPAETRPVLGGAPTADASGPRPTPRPSFSLCIAVGASADATLYQYGPTWFERIVPVLSDLDVARAAHLDPDVLADPAAWPFPDRLAPCGGRTGNELYIFEARLSELRLTFPHLTNATFTEDDPVAVIVYRDPLPGVINAVRPSDRPRHDICLASEVEGAQPDHVILRGVDITGFHVRIDRELAGPQVETPEPTLIDEHPVATLEPLPAWAGDATSVLQCRQEPVERVAALTRDVVPGDTPDTVLRMAMEAIRQFDFDLPSSGYELADEAEGGRLYVVRADGAFRTALAITVRRPGDDSEWILSSVASCDPAEFDPSTPTGRDAFGQWLDEHGSPPPAATLRALEDCYGGTQVFYGSSLFVRIPFGGVDETQLESTWDPDVPLPSSATDTGLRSGAARLFVAGDGSALFVERDGRAERLPHVKGDEVQRTDCN